MEMKKAAQIGAGIALAGAIGYGAWYMYAKTNPKSARELKSVLSFPESVTGLCATKMKYSIHTN